MVASSEICAGEEHRTDDGVALEPNGLTYLLLSCDNSVINRLIAPYKEWRVGDSYGTHHFVIHLQMYKVEFRACLKSPNLPLGGNGDLL